MLHNLQKCEDIIINPADKGGAVVLWHWHHYTKEAAKQMAEMCYFKMPLFMGIKLHKMQLHPEVAKIFL